MANNKKPNKHKPGIDPKIELRLRAEFKKENMNARRAGIEYGHLALKIASLMILINQSNKVGLSSHYLETTFIEELQACKEIIMEGKPINDMIITLREKGYDISNEELIRFDPSLSQYF